MKRAIVANGRVVSAYKITEEELLQIETLRGRVLLAKSNLTNAETALADAEADIIARLEAGVTVVKASNLQAGVDEEIGPRRPEWKDLYLGHMEDVHGRSRGVEEAMILSETAGKPKQILRIIHRFPGRSVQ